MAIAHLFPKQKRSLRSLCVQLRNIPKTQFFYDFAASTLTGLDSWGKSIELPLFSRSELTVRFPCVDR
jgi:hypothetical protein